MISFLKNKIGYGHGDESCRRIVLGVAYSFSAVLKGCMTGEMRMFDRRRIIVWV